MEISLKKLLLAGIGSIAYTYEKGAILVDELVKKGDLTLSQGRQLNEELKRKFKPQAGETATAGQSSDETVKTLIASMDLATREELKEIRHKLDMLEATGKNNNGE